MEPENTTLEKENHLPIHHFRAGQYLSVVTIPESLMWLWNHLVCCWYMSTLLWSSALVKHEWCVHHAAGGTSAKPQGVRRNYFPLPPSPLLHVLSSFNPSFYILSHLHFISSITDMHTQVYLGMGCPSHTGLIHDEQGQIKSHHPIRMIPFVLITWSDARIHT